MKNVQVAVAWILQKPGISAPILRATKSEYIDDAIGTMSLKLTDDKIKRLEEAYKPRAILGHV